MQLWLQLWHTHVHTNTHTHIPLLSTIVMTEVLGEPISTTSGLSTEVIINVKYSNGSAVSSSFGDTVKMAYGWPALKLTESGPGVKSLPAVKWNVGKKRWGLQPTTISIPTFIGESWHSDELFWSAKSHTVRVSEQDSPVAEPSESSRVTVKSNS